MKKIIGLLLVSLCFTGCNSYKKEIPTGKPFKISNVYTAPLYDYTKLRNVLLLPVANPLEHHIVDDYQHAIALETTRNFGKFHYFNVQYDNDYKHKYPQNLAPNGLINLDTDQINRAALGGVGKEYHAQAALQLNVLDLQVFPPMRIHLKGGLFDTNTGERIWSLDHVFDADDAEVVNGMRLWWNTRMAGGDEFNRFETQKITPSFFLNYVFYKVAESYGQSRSENVVKINKIKKKKTAQQCNQQCNKDNSVN